MGRREKEGRMEEIVWQCILGVSPIRGSKHKPYLQNPAGCPRDSEVGLYSYLLFFPFPFGFGGSLMGTGGLNSRASRSMKQSR